MLDYLEFIVIWLLFMALLGVVTVLVPKIAAKLDEARKKQKRNTEKPFSLKQSTYMTPIGEDELKETTTEEEN